MFSNRFPPRAQTKDWHRETNLNCKEGGLGFPTAVFPICLLNRGVRPGVGKDDISGGHTSSFFRFLTGNWFSPFVDRG